MSALVQGGGYTVAATGPFVLGVVHEASGDWTAPLAVVIGSIVVLCVAGLLSSGSAPAGLSPVEARRALPERDANLLDCDRPRRRHRPAARPRQPGHRAARDHHGDGQLDAGQRHAQRARRRDDRGHPRRPDRRGLPAPAGRRAVDRAHHPRQHRTGRAGAARADAHARPAPRRRRDHRDGPARGTRHGHAGADGRADQRRAGRAQGATHRRPGRRGRAHGRGRDGRQLERGRGVQHRHRPGGRAHRVRRGLAGHDGRARSHAPGPRHPGRRRPHRRPRHPTGPVRHRGAGVLRHDLPRRAGLPAPAGARPMRGRPRDRPRGAHDPAGAGHGGAGREPHARHDRRRPPGPRAAGLPHAGGGGPGPRAVLAPRGRRPNGAGERNLSARTCAEGAPMVHARAKAVAAALVVLGSLLAESPSPRHRPPPRSARPIRRPSWPCTTSTGPQRASPPSSGTTSSPPTPRSGSTPLWRAAARSRTPTRPTPTIRPPARPRARGRTSRAGSPPRRRPPSGTRRSPCSTPPRTSRASTTRTRTGSTGVTTRR